MSDNVGKINTKNLLGNDHISVSYPTRAAKIMQVIVTKSIIGMGTKESALRPVYRYWSLSGNLLAQMDYCPDETGVTNEEGLIFYPPDDMDVNY